MEVHQQNQNESGSLEIPKLEYSVQGDNRALAIALREIQEMKQELYELKTKKILEETGLPQEILEENGAIPDPPPRTGKRGKGYRPILMSEIIEAKKHCINAASIARYLKVHYKTYKKYAQLYGLHDPKPNIKGRANVFDPERGKYPLSEILEGKHPNVSTYKIKNKLVKSGIKKPECEQCGFKERRITDNKIPLLLNFLDDNPKNHSLDNMKLYCLNCTFMCGRGYIRNGKHWFDPDFLQGAEKEDIPEESKI